MPYKSVVEKRAQYRRWYQKNKKKILGWNRKRKEEIAAWIREQRASRSCERCGEDHVACLQFHHKDDDKEFDIANAMNMGFSKEKILKEMEKCMVLCANCHFKEHWQLV